MMRASENWFPLLFVLAAGGCSRPDPPEDAPATTPPTARAEAPATAAPGRTPCGPMGCLRFASAAAALEHVLQSQPEVVAVGEAHALAGTEGVKTATERFEQELLPLLAKQGATELVVELLKPAEGCQKTVAEVRKKQEPVVERQDTGNQNRFIQLGHASKKLGVTPYILEPSCEEYAGVVQGGPDGIVRMLELIADKTEQRVLRFWQRNSGARVNAEPSAPPTEGSAPAASAFPSRAKGAPADPAPPADSARSSEDARAEPAPSPSKARSLVVAYGGAMHNDVEVVPAKASFSFGNSLVQKTGGKYIALDLIVPEYIKPTETWKSFSWYPHFDAENPPAEVTLFRVGEQSYVLIFGKSEAAPAASQDALPPRSEPAGTTPSGAAPSAE